MAEKYLDNYRLRLITCNVFEPGNIYIYIYICIHIHMRVIFSRDIILFCIMGAYPFCGKVTQHLLWVLWVGSQVAGGEVTVGGITNLQIITHFLLRIHNLQIWLRS